jgi:hypothetical protein
MAAADQMLGDNLRRLHIIRADQVDIIEIAGAGSKHQRHTDLRRAIAQFALVDSPGDNHPVYTLRNQGIKTLTHFFPAAALGEKDHFPSASSASVSPAVSSA